MNSDIRNWKDCKDPRRVENFGKSHGCMVRMGKGDHRVMSFNHESETYYTGRREMSPGVAHAIWKFFLRTGLVAAAVLIGLLAIGVI